MSDRSVVVVGFGSVGRRRAAAVRRAAARLRVVSPGPRPAELAGDGDTEWVDGCYEAAHLGSASLAFACATPAVNARVVADARWLGVWVNSASNPAAGDFALPAVVRRGGLTVAVGTGGSTPAFARRLRHKLEQQFDAGYADFVRLLGAVRPAVLAAVGDAGRRRVLLDQLSDWPWLDRLRRDGFDATLAAMEIEIRREINNFGSLGDIANDEEV